jgi:hypothetical protein
MSLPGRYDEVQSYDFPMWRFRSNWPREQGDRLSAEPPCRRGRAPVDRERDRDRTVTRVSDHVRRM